MAISDAEKRKLNEMCKGAKNSALGTELQTVQTDLDTAEASLVIAEADIVVLEALAPTADEKAALAGTGTPAAGNVYVTNDTLVETIRNRDRKDSVRAATAAALPACTAAGTGVGKTLTGDANGALAAQDGVTLVATNRLLVQNQVAGKDNGIYALTQVGTAGTPFILTRAVDADVSAEITSGMLVFVEEGTVNGGQNLALTTANPITLDTTALVFSIYTGPTAVTYETVGNITSIDAADAAAAGTNNTTARGDHQHAVSTAAASTLDSTSTSTEGAATTLARSNHTHAITGLTTADQLAGIAANTPTGTNTVQTLTQIQERPFKVPVRAATAAALPACTAAGTGVGKTLTGDANGALAAQDGVTLVATNRLLVQNQVAGKDNGIYALTQVGDGGTPFILTRAVDADTSAKMASGTTVGVEEGNINKDKIFVLTTNNPITLDTTALVFDTQDGLIKRYTFAIGHADLTAGAVSEAIALSAFPANVIIIAGCIELDTDFSGGGAAACTAEIGDAGDPNELAAAVNIFTGAGAGLKEGEPVAITAFGFKAAYAPICTVTADVNVSTLDAGALIVHVYYREVETVS